jgi:hypothetical protein
MIEEAALTHGIIEGHPAHARLTAWLAERPAPRTFERARRVITEIMSYQNAAGRKAVARRLVDAAQRVATASGGFLGLGSKTSAEEKAVLEKVAAAIEAAHGDSARRVLGGIKEGDPAAGGSE